MEIIPAIQSKIYDIRGERVMLDRDLAALYHIELKVLNFSVKRNIKRFPEDFMFRLTKEEVASLRFQIETLDESDASLRSQNVTLKAGRGQHSKYLPYAFTEQGVAMLSGVLNSDRAINMNIAIMRAFIEVRRVLLQQNDIREQLKLVKERLGEHDVQLNQIYDAMENLLDERINQRKWEDRERIGFRN
ncbi:ORF6N domain-containing protein [Asinibacterium sp. OR53]|uniref:ORF6N domain-containing protein n=1 Tax=Asinibacterium sp. OR53 TaxID=925409 RepID=UPI00047DA622|nr:ORF6N domain-containing protein [Asinibacterium sp. OR53]